MSITGKRITMASIAVLATLLAGCSNPRAATTGNFAVAIRRYMSKQNENLCTQSLILPQVFDSQDAYGNVQQNDTTQYDDLEKAGVLTKSTRRVFHPAANAFVTAYTDTQTRYVLSAMGKRIASIGAADAPGYDVSFCYGKKVLDRVTNFTVPSANGPAILSRATYTYALTDVPSFATNAWFQAAFPDVKATLAGARTSRHHFMLLLTNNGWEVTQ